MIRCTRMISVIIPVHNNERTLPELHRRLVSVLRGVGEPFEIIAVDDGSRDTSRRLLAACAPITAVLLSKQFGESAALDAGFKMAIGDVIVTIDPELDCMPEDIPKIVSKLREGYGAVSGVRRGNAHLLSWLANALISRSTGVRLTDYNAPLKGYRREFVDGVELLGGSPLFLPVFAADRGASVAEVPLSSFGRRGRRRRLTDAMHFVFDLISVKFLLNYFSKPLHFFGAWSLFFSALALLSAVLSVALKVMKSTIVHPVLLPLIGVLFVILSIILFMLGFITEILLRIYYERKDSAPYLIYEVVKNK